MSLTVSYSETKTDPLGTSRTVTVMSEIENPEEAEPELARLCEVVAKSRVLEFRIDKEFPWAQRPMK